VQSAVPGLLLAVQHGHERCGVSVAGDGGSWDGVLDVGDVGLAEVEACRREVVGNAVGTAGADDGDDISVLGALRQDPGDGELRDGDAETVGGRAQPVGEGDVGSPVVTVQPR